jgi:hypothetical protein
MTEPAGPGGEVGTTHGSRLLTLDSRLRGATDASIRFGRSRAQEPTLA